MSNFPLMALCGSSNIMKIKCISTKFNKYIKPLNAHIYFVEVVCALSFCHNAGSNLTLILIGTHNFEVPLFDHLLYAFYCLQV